MIITGVRLRRRHLELGRLLICNCEKLSISARLMQCLHHWAHQLPAGSELIRLLLLMGQSERAVAAEPASRGRPCKGPVLACIGRSRGALPQSAGKGALRHFCAALGPGRWEKGGLCSREGLGKASWEVVMPGEPCLLARCRGNARPGNRSQPAWAGS